MFFVFIILVNGCQFVIVMSIFIRREDQVEVDESVAEGSWKFVTLALYTVFTAH